MANLQRRLPNNVKGDFFVDDTCINCDTCRQLSPEVFADDGEYSYVFQQPHTPDEERHALQALLACPTHSIGTTARHRAQETMADFPMLLEAGVYYCGFNSEKSFGGNSYFIADAGGNWLIDSPRFLPHLVKRFEAKGGIRYIFLTHQDDVADAPRYSEHFKAEIFMGEMDVPRHLAVAHPLPDQAASHGPGESLFIPTPGHTRGHFSMLWKNRYLFSGDHLWGSRRTGKLGASKNVCWHSWPQQIASMKRLLDFSFAWVLPGHGRRMRLDPGEVKRQLTALIAWMEEQ